MAEICESYHAIDLAWLRRQKMLDPGRSSSINWSRAGRPTGSIKVVASLDSVRLVYRQRVWGGEWQDMREIVLYTETRTCFGGRRRWFACPQCGEACRVLFGGPFRCRRCHGLRYGSQYETPWSRAASRMQKLRARLGGSANLTETFPPRPKHMQSKTYMRLRALDIEFTRRITAGLAPALYRLKPRA